VVTKNKKLKKSLPKKDVKSKIKALIKKRIESRLNKPVEKKAEPEPLTYESGHSKKYNFRKIHRQLQKTEMRLAKKNKLLMDLHKSKRSREAELEGLGIKVKDLEYLLAQKEKPKADAPIAPITTVLIKDHDAKRLQEDTEALASKVEQLKEEINKKDAIIELLQKPEYEYKGLVTLDIERVKAKWIGWSEGANLEEIDFNVINNSTDSIKNVHMDIYIEDAAGNNYTYKGYKIKSHMEPKERLSRKLHLFKQLKRKGNYKIEVRVFMHGHDKEIAEQTKILQI